MIYLSDNIEPLFNVLIIYPIFSHNFGQGHVGSDDSEYPKKVQWYNTKGIYRF
jgi:hypothetical protein